VLVLLSRRLRNGHLLDTPTVHRRAFPLDHVLDTLLDETDSFKDVGDVVYSSLLNVQLSDSVIEVDAVILRGLY
jgi:hypothetical protein